MTCYNEATNNTKQCIIFRNPRIGPALSRDFNLCLRELLYIKCYNNLCVKENTDVYNYGTTILCCMIIFLDVWIDVCASLVLQANSNLLSVRDSLSNVNINMPTYNTCIWQYWDKI